MKQLSTTQKRMAAVVLALLLALLIPGLRSAVPLVALLSILVLGIYVHLTEADPWEERLSASSDEGPDRLGLSYEGNLLEPEWPFHVVVDGPTRNVTLVRSPGVGRKALERVIAFDEISHLRYKAESSSCLSFSLVLKGDERVPLVKFDATPPLGRRSARGIALQEPGRPELLFDSASDDQRQYLSRRLRKLIGVGLTRPVPEDLGFGEANPSCQACGRTATPNQDQCLYCGGILAAQSRVGQGQPRQSQPGGTAPEPHVYEIP